MKAVIQRVSRAEVQVDGKTVSKIDQGILTLLGVMREDTEEQAEKLIRKIVELRIFEDDQGKMNRSLLDIGGAHLIVSQFTLAADTSSGKRPSFTGAERPDRAKQLYEKSIELSQKFGAPSFGGIFQADMKISLVNDGPVTFLLEY